MRVIIFFLTLPLLLGACAPLQSNPNTVASSCPGGRTMSKDACREQGGYWIEEKACCVLKTDGIIKPEGSSVFPNPAVDNRNKQPWEN